jgi:hypothetical protein
MLIFLDIDGVMVPAKSWASPVILEDGFPDFSAKATNTLRNLISEDVTIMLTTSHKWRYSIETWKTIFAKRGILLHKLDRLDDNVSHLNRKDEIMQWIDAHHQHEDFVILDDDTSLNDLPDLLKKHLILTSPIIGLTENHLEAVKSMMNKRVQAA